MPTPVPSRPSVSWTKVAPMVAPVRSIVPWTRRSRLTPLTPGRRASASSAVSGTSATWPPTDGEAPPDGAAQAADRERRPTTPGFRRTMTRERPRGAEARWRSSRSSFGSPACGARRGRRPRGASAARIAPSVRSRRTISQGAGSSARGQADVQSGCRSVSFVQRICKIVAGQLLTGHASEIGPNKGCVRTGAHDCAVSAQPIAKHDAKSFGM